MISRLAACVTESCEQIARFSESDQDTTRTFLCEAMHDCHRYLGEWMTRLGMQVNVDGAGNLHGLFGDETARRFLIGSHLDTVPNAGMFDGILGVVLGVALVQACVEAGKQFPFALEIVGFSEEEGVRFATPFLGSKGLVHGLNHASLAITDRNGITVADALRNFGLDPSSARSGGLTKAAGYLEFHIEQGPLLDTVCRPLGIVRSIVGQSRATVSFTGQANHAGTTPMTKRYDALACAAEWITAVEQHASATEGLVATVGKLDVRPNGSNVIPGEVFATIDVRHEDDDVRSAAFADLLKAGASIAKRRQLQFTSEKCFEQNTVPMDAGLTSLVEQACLAAGLEAVTMTSGAGHDALIMADKLPCAMIFLRSPGGISHHPDESVKIGDVECALTMGLAFLDRLAGWEGMNLANA